MKIKFLWTLLTTLLIASSMYAQRPIPENTMVSETALLRENILVLTNRSEVTSASMLPRRRRYTWYAENDMT